MPEAIGRLDGTRPNAFFSGMIDWVDGERTLDEVFEDIDSQWRALGGLGRVVGFSGPGVPLPGAVARFNQRYTNRYIEPAVRRSSGFAVVHHVGRRSGREYRTPVNVFDLDGDLIVALTYGPTADWVRNVFADPAQVVRSGSMMDVADASIVGRETAWPALPWFVRLALRVMWVHDFARLTVEHESGRHARR